ncbi:MAG: triose-phosphate isomerase [Gammaproteobacteria bacterium]|nr:triose-phosphate isomerase [Gammaproteobacteria bacterium]
MRQPFVAGNWKLNGSKQLIKNLLEAILDGSKTIKNAEIAVFSPFLYIQQVAELLEGSSIAYGSQNVSEYNAGAYTGEVSAAMLKEFSCKYAIVGHSERRAIYGESDQQVAQKFIMAQHLGIRPILCVGELLEERESGNTEKVVARQLDAVISAAGINAIEAAVIAYEPVWAIGTGKTATPQQAQEVHAFIRERLSRSNDAVATNVRILYGGSVKPNNATELFAQTDIDGGLIGGASLDAADFLAICQAAN